MLDRSERSLRNQLWARAFVIARLREEKRNAARHRQNLQPNAPNNQNGQDAQQRPRQEGQVVNRGNRSPPDAPQPRPDRSDPAILARAAALEALGANHRIIGHYAASHSNMLTREDIQHFVDLIQHAVDHTQWSQNEYLQHIFEKDAWNTSIRCKSKPTVKGRKAQDVITEIGQWTEDCYSKQLRKHYIDFPDTCLCGSCTTGPGSYYTSIIYKCPRGGGICSLSPYQNRSYDVWRHAGIG